MYNIIKNFTALILFYLIVMYAEKLLEDIRLPADISWRWRRVNVNFEERTWPYDENFDQSSEEPEDYLFHMVQ
jgi:hypothetical protein